MSARAPAHRTVPATAPRRRPRPVTVTLLTLYVAAAAVGLGLGGTTERLLGLALLATIALRLAPYRRAARWPERPEGCAPPAAVRARATGDGGPTDA
ncbi:hypothetical protein F0L17_01210 [Streptomyces sp. TRM43335]|uniref:Uncharacterized protein n=1 Tax=Streptomyces taklimakanensis TaxID=2569853 RepID=A0A6G2B791_9ACTN|nr:hypothetical protein [Streptomyces taklimakanensis]MTE17772.1 hypothetical protein [Streptomyces taklimakanensis]